MPIQTDVLMTVFQVRGLSSVLSAFNAEAAAQQRLADIEAKVNSGTVTGAALQTLHERALTAKTAAVKSAAEAELALSAVLAGIAVSAVSAITSALGRAIDAYAKFGEEVLNIQSLTGASARESAGAVEQFQAAGIKSAQAQQEILRLSHDLMTAQGAQGLGQIGISQQAGENGIHLMNRVLSKLREMPDGMRKAGIETELFGERGTAAIQPLLRLTQEQAEAANALGNAFSGGALEAIQKYQFAVNMLGQTFMAQLVFPLVQELLPALTWVTGELTGFINIAGQINSAFGGIPLIALSFGAIAGAIGLVLVTIPPLLTALKSIALVEAVIDALAGQWQNIAAAAAIGAVGGIGIYGMNSLNGDSGSGPGSNGSALNANTQAMQQNTAVLSKFNDSWQQFNRGGVPRGLQRGDIAELNRQQRLHSFG